MAIRSKTAALLAGLALAGCSLGSQPSVPYMESAAALESLNQTGAGKIKHVVYIVQENRSFDDLFHGYPGADTVSSGKDSKDHTILLKPVPLSDQYVIDHSAAAMFAACNGTGKLPGTKCRMNGFNNESYCCGPRGVKYPMYVYAPHSDTKPYFDMAHEGVVADRMFQSHLDESFVSHQYIIAAQAASSVDLPYGAWGCEGGSSDVVETITQNRQVRPAPSGLLRLSDARRRARPCAPVVAFLRQPNMEARRAEPEAIGRAIRR